MALLDQYGRPVQVKALLEPVAEGGTTGVRQSFTDSVASGLTPQKLAGVLKSCDEGDIEAFMTLAEEIEERDPHYASVMGQRKRAVSGVAPTVIPASEDTRDIEIADWVRDNIATHDTFPSLVEDLLDAIGKGFSVVEIMWARDKTNWWPGSYVWRPQRFFQFDKETGRELRLRDESDPMDGVAVDPYKFIYHVAKLKSGHAFRGGTARVALFSWMCKAYSVKDWVAFVETYGLPLRLGRYDGQATKEDVATLFRAVANIGTDAAAVLPKYMDIEFIDNKSGGGSQPVFENLARWVDEQTSKLVLGQTMTTDNGSSQAQANVHNEVRHDVAASDARSVSGSINRDLVRPSVDLNFGPQEKYPQVKIVIEEPEDLEMMVNAITSLAGAGVTFKQSEARLKLKMTDPEKGDEIFGGTAAPAPVGKNRTSTDVALNRAQDGDADELDQIEAEMLAEWEPVMAEMLSPIETAIADASSYEDAMNRLGEIEGLPKSKLIDQLVKGAFKARSLGDVRDG